MAIFTRYGSEVELLSEQDKDGYVQVKRLADGALREWHVSELRTDNQADLVRLYQHKEPRHD